MHDGVLLRPMDGLQRTLTVTKQVLQPLEDIRAVISGKVNGIPKFRLYSAHDDNIANHLALYLPSYNWNGIVFAANIQFELYDIFGVWYIQIRYNGVNMTPAGCNDHSMCQAEPFLKHMSDYTYHGDLQAACN